MTDTSSTTPVMDKAAMEQAARNQFWTVDAEIRKAQAKLKVCDTERNALADEETAMRAKVREIGARKQAIVKAANLVELCQERSRYAIFLNRKTGTKENH